MAKIGDGSEIADEPEIADDAVIESTFYKMSDQLARRIHDLLESTQKKFKVFYYSTVRDLEAEAHNSSKSKDFDDALDNLLDRIGGRKESARHLGVELIAERKLKIVGQDGQPLPPADINAQFDLACGLADKLELYRKGATGDIVFDLAFKAVAQQIPPDGTLSEADQLDGPEAGEVNELLEAAEEFNCTFSVFGMPDKKGVGDALRQAMDAAGEYFEENLRKEGDSELTTAAKKNIFVAFATVNFLRNNKLVALALPRQYDELMPDNKQRTVLESIAPAHEWLTNMKLNGERVTI